MSQAVSGGDGHGARRAGRALTFAAAFALATATSLAAASPELGAPERERFAPFAGGAAATGGGAAATGGGAATASRRRRQFLVAYVRPGASVLLRSRPGGRALARLGARTELGSSRALWIAATRGRWLGVATPLVANGRLGWIELSRRKLQLYRTGLWLRADLSRRELQLRRGRRVVRRIRVAIGRPGSPTPTGRFAVTDLLVVRSGRSPYGCCILALSGRQPSPPPGWVGGDRLAIHGTSAPASIGRAASSGCLRASAGDLRWLLRRVPLGTPVFIRP